jgi:hypothetical protein
VMPMSSPQMTRTFGMSVSATLPSFLSTHRGLPGKKSSAAGIERAQDRANVTSPRLRPARLGSCDVRAVTGSVYAAALGRRARSHCFLLSRWMIDAKIAALALVSGVCSLVVAYEAIRYRESRVRVRHPALAA